jgi:streptogramin lyase
VSSGGVYCVPKTFSRILERLVDRFNPTTGKFTECPFPSRTQMIRFFALDPQGRVWFTDFANSRIGVLETDDMKISAQR